MAGTSVAQVGVAWLAMLAASLLPDIVASARDARVPVGWLGALRLAVLGALSALTFLADDLRPIGPFVLALTASALGDLLVARLRSAARWSGEASPTSALMRQALLHLIPAVCMGVVLLATMSGPGPFFASPALDRVARLPPLPPLSWSVLAPALALLLAGPLIPAAWRAVAGASRGTVLDALPRALVFAAVNAGQEEFRFRVVLITTALPALGADQALILSSAFFGLAHFFGRPSGMTGMALAGIAGLALGATMIGTASVLPAWLMHAVLDVLIYSTVALPPHR